MSTLLLMKLFESIPSRYDRGIRWLTGGRLEYIYDRLTSHVKPGDHVLDVGCGTGALSLRAAKKGARVKAIDINPAMLDIARRKAEEAGLSQSIEFAEMGVAELGREEDQSYDAVMSGLCLSELSKQEQDYTLHEAHRILRPEGLLLVADEVSPEKLVKKIFNALFRSLLKAFVFLATRTTTRALKNFKGRIEKRGFQIISSELSKGQDFLELVAKKMTE
jgi:ubiquinone/menaquinone biosynthesis C-methylase UbiE